LPALSGLGNWVAKLGLRAIPVVGEVMMAIDAVQALVGSLRFLSSHAKDIGKLIGDAAHWLMKNGGPLLLAAVQSVWNGVVDSVKFLFNGIRDSIAGIFNGGHGGIFDFFRNVIGGAIQQYNADAAADGKKGASSGPATSGAASVTTSVSPVRGKDARDGTSHAHAKVTPSAGATVHVKETVRASLSASDGLHVHGNVTVHVNGGDPKKVVHAIVKQAHALARNHLPKGTPHGGGMTNAGLTNAQATGYN
jgi:hypothetical protein